MPKEFLPIVDKPLIQYTAEKATAADIDTLTFVTGRNKRAIEDHFDANNKLETLPDADGGFSWERTALIGVVRKFFLSDG